MIRPTALLWAVLILTACGYRTPPQPYEHTTVDLPVIAGASLNFRGDDLVFRWRLSDYGILGSEGRRRLMSTGEAHRLIDHADATGDADTKGPGIGDDPPAATDATGDQTVEEPATVIRLFRLNLFGDASDCSDCGPVLLARIILPVFDGRPDLETFDERVWRREAAAMPKDHHLSWNPIEGFVFTLPADLFDEGVLEDRRFFTLDYGLTDERFAMPSSRLYPSRPHPVPPAAVTVRKLLSVRQHPFRSDPGHLVWSDFSAFIGLRAATGLPIAREKVERLPLPLWPGRTQTGETVFIEETVYDPKADACRAPTMVYFLLLEWQPQHETIVHVSTADGRFYEAVRHYGVNFYRVRPVDPYAGPLFGQTFVDGGSEKRINTLPLLNGSFSISNFHDRLFARHVDRYGNESVAVPVFDGRYE